MNLTVPDELSENEANAALFQDACKRLSSASWEAQREAEQITHDNKRSAEKRIAAARAALDECEKYLRAIRKLERVLPR